MLAVRGVQVVGANTGGVATPPIDPFWYEVKTTRNSSSGRAITVGTIVVQDATDLSVDAVAAADTVNVGRKFVGVVAEIGNDYGKILDNQYIAAGTAGSGRVRVFQHSADVVYRCTEDGLGGVMASSARSVGIAVGAATQTTSTETFTPNPESNDLLDSSTASSTATTNMCKLVGKSPNIVNDGLTQAGAATNFTYDFKINSSYAV